MRLGQGKRQPGIFQGMRQLHLRGKLLAGDGVQFHFDIGRRQWAAFQGAPQLVGGEAQRLRQLGALRDALHHRNQPGIEDQLHFLAVARLAKPLRPT